MRLLNEAVAQFNIQYGSEADCCELVEKLRWPDGYGCPSCEFDQFYRIQTRRLPLFQCRQCGNQTSLTAGTLMHKSRTPLRKWLLTMYLVATQSYSINAVSLSDILGVTYKTAWAMLHGIRKVISESDGQVRLSGHIEAKHELFLNDYWMMESRMAQEKSMIIAREVGEQQPPRYKMKLIMEDRKVREPLNEKHAYDFAMHSCEGELLSFAMNPRYQFSRLLTVFEQEKHHPRTKLIAFYPSPAMYGQRQQITDCEPAASLSVVAMNARNWMGSTFSGISARYAQYYFDEFCFRLNHTDWEAWGLFEKLVALGVTQRHSCSPSQFGTGDQLLSNIPSSNHVQPLEHRSLPSERLSMSAS